MKVVIVKPPKLLNPVLKKFFKIRKEEDSKKKSTHS